MLGLVVLLGAGVLWTAVAAAEGDGAGLGGDGPQDGVFTAGEAQHGLVTSVTVNEGEDVAQGQVLAKVRVAEGEHGERDEPGRRAAVVGGGPAG